MIRVSATLLESFRRMIETEYVQEKDVIDQVRRVEIEPSWQMQAGTAWHHLLRSFRDPSFDDEEDGRISDLYRDGHLYLVDVDDYTFNAADAELAASNLGPGQWEVKKVEEMIVGGWQVQMVAQVDHIHGLKIQENKAKFSNADARDYEQSLQWRVYLHVHAAQVVQYNLFSFRDPKDGFLELTNTQSFRFFPYRTLVDDLRSRIRDFCEWAEFRELLDYLQPKEEIEA